jgi:hypothetical protein
MGNTRAAPADEDARRQRVPAVAKNDDPDYAVDGRVIHRGDLDAFGTQTTCQAI